MTDNLTKKAAEFLAANRLSPVVSGAAMHVEAECPENVIGCRYTLDNGRTFSLRSADLRTLPVPRWKGVSHPRKAQHDQ